MMDIVDLILRESVVASAVKRFDGSSIVVREDDVFICNHRDKVAFQLSQLKDIMVAIGSMAYLTDRRDYDQD